MAKTQEEANRILSKFDNELENLISEHLVDCVTRDQVNEYYGWANDCQIAEMLSDAEALDEMLKAETAQ